MKRSGDAEALGKSRQRRARGLLGAASALGLALMGCSADGDPNGTSGGDPQAGADLYRQFCASCHGLSAEGATAPALLPWTRGESALVSIIDETMPKNDPSQCTGTCPKDIAAYLLGGATACKANTPHYGPRKLRLLTRREYNSTVRDLFGLGKGASGASCSQDADCDLSVESCVAGSCALDPCNLHTFIYPAGGKQYNSVHVAGTFNNWPGTLAAGGWPMTYVAAKDLYYVKRTLSNDTYQYKFVLDESNWVADPKNPVMVPDGFGGDNSVLTLGCSAGGGDTGVIDWAKDFPVESRPKGFGFDNAADAGLVTSVHVEQYMKAAALLAEKATQDLPALLPCDPAQDAPGCASQFVSSFGERAFRRPLSTAEVDKYKGIILGQPSFSQGVNVALQVMLSSPYFLYRFEIGTPQIDGSFKLNPYEVASALSYTFWGTMPDQALFDAAKSGALSTQAGVEEQARRLLADPRGRETMGVFALQWLGVERILTADKSATLFPMVNEGLRQAMAEETRSFVTHVIFDSSHTFDELLTADYTFADQALASFYGIPNVSGGTQKVASPPERMAGILGHASVLASYAHSDQSSPIRRGLFVREYLLCQEFGQPPPSAGGVPEVDPNATTRERFRQHTANEVCYSCHQYIDDLGFGFENFDAVGQYRTSDSGQPIDANGDMNDVEKLGSKTHAPFTNISELSGILASSRQAKTCFAQQYGRFATGRLETAADLCAEEEIDARFEASGYDVRELLVAVVSAPSFLVRK